MLAMDGIGVVQGERAIGAFEENLAGPEDGLQQPQEQPHVHDHDDHREDPSAPTHQGDVAEPCRGERRDREVQRVDVARDLQIEMVLRDVDDGGDDEDEDTEIDGALDDVLVPTDPQRIGAQVAQQVIRPPQPGGSAAVAFRSSRRKHPQMVDTVIVEQEAPTSAVCWPAIFAGGVVAASFTLLLLALGAGLGFAVVSPWRGMPDISSAKAATVGGIFMAVTAVMASAPGGYIAGRLRVRWQAAGDEAFFRDTAHGLLAWAFATVLGAALLTSAATVVAGGVAAGAGQATQKADSFDPALDRLFRPASMLLGALAASLAALEGGALRDGRRWSF